jgi:hypothetical protein
MNEQNLVWGLHPVRETLVRAPERVLELWVLGGRADERMEAVLELARAQGIACQAVRRDTLDGMAQGGTHQGVVARLAPAAPLDEDDLEAEHPVLARPRARRSTHAPTHAPTSSRALSTSALNRFTIAPPVAHWMSTPATVAATTASSPYSVTSEPSWSRSGDVRAPARIELCAVAAAGGRSMSGSPGVGSCRDVRGCGRLIRGRR